MAERSGSDGNSSRDPDGDRGGDARAVDFVETLAAATPTPGGGAAAAHAGRLATALLRMVTGLTLAKASRNTATSSAGGDAASWDEVRALARAASALSTRFAELETADAAAFDAWLAARRLPRGSADEQAVRRARTLDAACEATRIPLETLDAALATVALVARLLAVAERVRLRAEADLGGALELAHAAFRGAEINVRVNLRGLGGDARERELASRRQELVARFESLYPEIRARLLARLETS